VQWAANVPGGHSVFSLIGALARFWEPFAVQLFQSLAVFGLATQHLRYEFDSYNPHASSPEQMKDFISPMIACAQGLFFVVMEVDMGAAVALLVTIYEDMYAIAVPIEPILLRMNNHEMAMDDCRRWFSLARSVQKFIKPDGTFVSAAQATQLLSKAKPNDHLH
jgi:hypothetical protein